VPFEKAIDRRQRRVDERLRFARRIEQTEECRQQGDAGPERDQQTEYQDQGQDRLPGEGRGDQQELAGEHAERRQAGNRKYSERKAHRQRRDSTAAQNGAR